MVVDHSLNPYNVSEGGDSLVSEWGTELRSMRLEPHPTILYHESLLYPNLVGSQPSPATPKSSLPYINDSMGGPIVLGPEDLQLI